MLRKPQNWGIILKKGLEFSKTHSPTRLKKKKGREQDPQNYKQETELEMTNKALFSFLSVEWIQQAKRHLAMSPTKISY